MTDLTPTDAVRQCADRGLVNTLPIPSDVVCYSRTTAGSEAVYICDDGFHQDGAATRVCQSDGAWNTQVHHKPTIIIHEKVFEVIADSDCIRMWSYKVSSSSWKKCGKST